MEWSSLAPAAFSLIGVAIGTTGSIAVGYFTTRTTREQTRIQQIASLRTEQKEIILEYLRQMQTFHDFAVDIWHPTDEVPARNPDEIRREARQRSTELWFSQKKLLLVASPKLREASIGLTEKLEDAIYKDRPPNIEFWPYIDAAQDCFLEAARVELGISMPGIALARVKA